MATAVELDESSGRALSFSAPIANSFLEPGSIISVDMNQTL